MAIPEQDYVFFADESGISNDRFTVVGGICMHKNSMATVYKTLAQYRAAFKMMAELNWAKISDQKLVEYQWLVDYFFALNNANHLHFHCITFDSHQWNHNRYNNGDGDTGLSKLYFQLILHKFIRRYAAHGSLYVCLDHRHSTTKLEDLKRMLNLTAKRDHNLDDTLKQLISNHSHDEELLQLNDVILGAVCAVRNNRHLLADYRKSKRLIAMDVLQKSGLVSFERDSPRDIHKRRKNIPAADDLIEIGGQEQCSLLVPAAPQLIRVRFARIVTPRLCLHRHRHRLPVSKASNTAACVWTHTWA